MSETHNITESLAALNQSVAELFQMVRQALKNQEEEKARQAHTAEIREQLQSSVRELQLANARAGKQSVLESDNPPLLATPPGFVSHGFSDQPLQIHNGGSPKRNTGVLSHVPRVEVPICHGEVAVGWIFQMERYLEHNHVTPYSIIDEPYMYAGVHSISICSPSVCLNVDIDWSSYCAMRTNSICNQSYILSQKKKVRFDKPPAKPLDDIVIYAATEADIETIWNKVRFANPVFVASSGVIYMDLYCCVPGVCQIDPMEISSYSDMLCHLKEGHNTLCERTIIVLKLAPLNKPPPLPPEIERGYRDFSGQTSMISNHAYLLESELQASRDFGMSTVYWPDYVATRWYRAPELCGSSFCKYTSAIEIWSVRCIFAEVLTGKPLFSRKSVVHQLDLITDLLGTPPAETVSGVRNDKARKYLQAMRRKQPVSFAQKFPIADPLAVQLFERMLAFDPKDRITAEQALAHPYFKGLAKIQGEPFFQPISKLEFEFERRMVTKDDVRELIFREILEYHPNLLKDYLSGARRRGFGMIALDASGMQIQLYQMKEIGRKQKNAEKEVIEGASFCSSLFPTYDFEDHITVKHLSVRISHPFHLTINVLKVTGFLRLCIEFYRWMMAPIVKDMASVTYLLDHAHFIITNTYQEVAQVDDSHQGFTLTGPYCGIHGIDAFDTVFTIVSPGVDMTIYFSYNDDYKRLTTRHKSIEVVIDSSLSDGRLDWVKNLMILLFETAFLNLGFSLSLDDHAILVRYITKFIMFSLPRPPEVGDLENKVNFKAGGMLRIGILWNLMGVIAIDVINLV